MEHLSLDQLKEGKGDRYIWAALDERIPDKLTHDWLAECLQEVFRLEMEDNESMVTWTAGVEETFSKCKRKVEVDFPSQARGWICLRNSALNNDQRAIVTARMQGDFKFEALMAAMRSCYPEFRAPPKSTRSSVYVAQHHEAAAELDSHEALQGEEEPGAVQLEEMEEFLAEHGVQEPPHTTPEAFDEAKTRSTVLPWSPVKCC